MALTGRVLCWTVRGNYGLGLLRGFLYFVVIGSAYGRIFSYKSIPDTEFEAGDEETGNIDHRWLNSEDLWPQGGVFTDVMGTRFHQLALTESVKNEGAVCFTNELQSVPVRTQSVSRNASSDGETSGAEQGTVGTSGCTRSFHLCAREAESQQGDTSWIHLGKHSFIDIGYPCSIDHVSR